MVFDIQIRYWPILKFEYHNDHYLNIIIHLILNTKFFNEQLIIAFFERAINHSFRIPYVK